MENYKYPAKSLNFSLVFPWFNDNNELYCENAEIFQRQMATYIGKLRNEHLPVLGGEDAET